MDMKKYILIIVLLGTLHVKLYSQTKKIKGNISTNTESLTEIAISLKGTTDTVVINEAGGFKVNAASQDIILVKVNNFVYDEIEIGEKTLINIEIDIPKKECKYTGNGFLDLENNMTPQKSEKIIPGLYNNAVKAEQLLEGNASGLFVAPVSGAPGSDYSVNINGISTNFQSNPLYIIDGMPSHTIAYLEPQDIETFEIITDPSALSLYGVKAGNGVVLVKTKMSKANIGKIQYNFLTGIQNTNASVDLMDADQYISFIENGMINEGRSQAFIDSVLNGNMGANTNWLEELFEPAFLQKHVISFSGGTATSKYYASGSYLNQNGIIGNEESNYEKFSVRLNADYSINKRLEAGARFNYVHSNRKYISDNTDENSIIKSALNFDPTAPLYKLSAPNNYMGNPGITEVDGKYFGMSELIDNSTIINPLAQLYNDQKPSGRLYFS